MVFPNFVVEGSRTQLSNPTIRTQLSLSIDKRNLSRAFKTLNFWISSLVLLDPNLSSHVIRVFGPLIQKYAVHEINYNNNPDSLLIASLSQNKNAIYKINISVLLSGGVFRRLLLNKRTNDQAPYKRKTKIHKKRASRKSY